MGLGGDHPANWKEGVEGLVPVEDPALMSMLQAMLTATHKTTDNWTRDRGCRIHGVNGCDWAHASGNRVPVPNGYLLRIALRNQNLDLWRKYSIAKTSISHECARDASVLCKEGMHAQYSQVSTATTSVAHLDAPLASGCNEWRLFHGCGPAACQGICSANFRLDLSGTGATWKDTGKTKGTPLYGFGVYLAERATKADEYAAQVQFRDFAQILGPEFAFSDYGKLHCLLVVRCIGGRTNIVTTNEIDTQKLR